MFFERQRLLRKLYTCFTSVSNFEQLRRPGLGTEVKLYKTASEW